MCDDQPKHRQMRKEQQDLARHTGARQGLSAVLIVCEGRETGPNNIEGLCEHQGVNSAVVKVVRGESETDTVGLVFTMQKRFTTDSDYDLVYVVCDVAAPRLAEARQRVQRTLHNGARGRTQVQVIASYPGFEDWLLLHFVYSARPYRAAADATDALRRHVTGFAKNDRHVFAKVETKAA